MTGIDPEETLDFRIAMRQLTAFKYPLENAIQLILMLEVRETWTYPFVYVNFFYP